MTPDARRKARLLAMRARLVGAALDGQGDDVAVARKAGVDKSTIGRWRKGNISFEGLEQLASGLRLDIVLKFPAHGHPSADAKESPPAWAEGLERRIASEVVSLLASPDGVDAAIAGVAHLARLRRQRGAGSRTGAGQPSVAM